MACLGEKTVVHRVEVGEAWKTRDHLEYLGIERMMV